MGLVQSIFLYGLAAAAVPVVVHLIFRWQTRRVDLGTVRFLTSLLRENARRRRLKRWLLLAARMTAVVLLVLAFARPYLPATQRKTSGRLLVVLIDQSASMGLHSGGDRLIDVAVHRGRQLLSGIAEEADWELAFFDHRVHPWSPREADASVLSGLEAPATLAGATDFGAAMAWARDLCVKSAAAKVDVYVLTDLQRSGLDWTSTGSFPENARVHIEDLGKPLVKNVAVTAATPARTVIRPNELATIDVTVFNFGPFPLEEAPVTLVLTAENRTQRLRETVSLDPGQAAQLTFETPPLARGEWTGLVQIELDDDELAFDNRRHLFLLAAPQLRVLLVDGSQSSIRAMSSTFYLEAALRLAPRGETYEPSPFVPDVIRATDADLPDLVDYDVVVLADTGGLSASEASRLGDYVKTGGRLLVFSGEQMTVDACVELEEAGVLPGRVTGIARSRDLPFRWDAWEGGHDLFAPFADPQYGELRRLAFDAHTQIEPAADARVLARYRGGEPALLDHSLGSGRVMWFTSAADRSWGDWPRSRLYVPLVHQMLSDLTGLTGGGPVRPVTIAAGLPDSVSPEIGVSEQNGRWQVTNLGPRESETDRCTIEEFAARFEVTLPEEDESASAASAAATGGLDLRNDELWQWVVLALIVLLCGEQFLANRTTV